MALVREVASDSVDFEDLHDFPGGETDAYDGRTHDVLLARPVATNQPTRLSIIDHDEQALLGFIAGCERVPRDAAFGSVELVLEEYSESSRTTLWHFGAQIVPGAPMQPMLADMFWDFSWFQFNGFTRRCFTSTSWLHASWGRAPLRQWHSWSTLRRPDGLYSPTTRWSTRRRVGPRAPCCWSDERLFVPGPSPPKLSRAKYRQVRRHQVPRGVCPPTARSARKRQASSLLCVGRATHRHEFGPSIVRAVRMNHPRACGEMQQALG